MCEGVERVSLKAEAGNAGMSAIVTFSSHYTASMAKKVVMEGMWDCKLIHGVYEWMTVNIVHAYLNAFTLLIFKRSRSSMRWRSLSTGCQPRNPVQTSYCLHKILWMSLVSPLSCFLARPACCPTPLVFAKQSEDLLPSSSLIDVPPLCVLRLQYPPWCFSITCARQLVLASHTIKFPAAMQDLMGTSIFLIKS